MRRGRKLGTLSETSFFGINQDLIPLATRSIELWRQLGAKPTGAEMRTARMFGLDWRYMHPLRGRITGRTKPPSKPKRCRHCGTKLIGSMGQVIPTVDFRGEISWCHQGCEALEQMLAGGL